MSKSILGFHYDIARGTYLTPDTFCKAVRLAAQSGYTHFIPYLENMIRLPSLSKACPTCAYTPDDWRSFESVAYEAGIELVPHFNVIGHTELICPTYPKLGGLVDRGHMDVDVERAVTRRWTMRCLGEFCNFSKGRHFLIGGDEWQPPQHLLARRDFDTAKAWVHQINLAVEFLVKRGRKPIVWHDMLIHFPSVLPLLSREAIIAFWFYDWDSDYPALEMFKKHGFETWMASAVFGGASSVLTTRSLKGLGSAARAAKKHHADGRLVTTWENTRWEAQLMNIPLAAKILRGARPSAALTDALTDADLIQKLPPVAKLIAPLKSKALKLLCHAEWKHFPELHRSLLATLSGNLKDDAVSHARFHYPQGRMHEMIQTGSRSNWDAPRPLVRRKMKRPSFDLRVDERDSDGAILRFFNAEESFEIYPKFGGSLQNWRLGDQLLIGSPIKKFLPRARFPGGYRSYSGAGGFRPIWALGTHSNPCILWQYPWRWRIKEQSANRIVAELGLELPHVSITVRIGIARQTTGFTYEARSINKLKHAWGAFSFNLPLTFHLEDLAGMKLSWKGPKGTRSTTVASEAKSVFMVPAKDGLVIGKSAWKLKIDAARDKTAGFFVDWGPGYITPDLHGIYRKLKVGEETITHWRFSLNQKGNLTE